MSLDPLQRLHGAADCKGIRFRNRIFLSRSNALQLATPCNRCREFILPNNFTSIYKLKYVIQIRLLWIVYFRRNMVDKIERREKEQIKQTTLVANLHRIILSILVYS